MTRGCTTACEDGKHTPACLFAALVESPQAKPAEPGWELPFNVVVDDRIPPGVIALVDGLQVLGVIRVDDGGEQR